MSRERVAVECRWPDCAAVVDLPRWHTPGDEVCPEHDALSGRRYAGVKPDRATP